MRINMDSIIDFKSGSPINESIEQLYPSTYNLALNLEKLNKLSKHKVNLDLKAYINLEKRQNHSPIKGGMFFKSPFRLANHHTSCQQCLYSFEIDTYGRGCLHDCYYCYARDILLQRDYWNNPMPAPAMLSDLWKVFYTVFETTKKNKYRSIMEKKIPIRIGSMSDSFMGIDKQFKITQELLKILKFYNYPYVIFTRSPLIANDEYLKLLDPELCSVQMSMSSNNKKLTKQIEPGAPSPQERLRSLKILSESNIWTTVRINPCFPTHPDGYYSDPSFKKSINMPTFDFTTPELIDDLKEYNVKSALLGFARLSPIAMKAINSSTGFDLRKFYKPHLKSEKDYHYSDAEINYYYRMYNKKCTENGIDFSTCYIGNGEAQFWKDQNIWSNKKDCCNIIGKVSSFKTNSREIPWNERVKHAPYKNMAANDLSSLHIPLGQS